MQMIEVHPRHAVLALASAGALALASCTSTSSSLSRSASHRASAATASVTETPTEDPGSTSPPAAPSSSPADAPADAPALAVGRPAAPAPNDPVAIPKPQPSAPATVLASVPRTPVANRPTNQIMMVRTTAYTHSESDHLKYGRKSAAGNTLQYGSQVRSAAADWSKYPLGTRFMIEGMPYEYVVDDYGSALVGTETIDIYKPEKGTMNQWGVRNVPIRVLEWGSFEESRKILDGRKHVRHADHVRKMLNEIEKKARTGDIPGGDIKA